MSASDYCREIEAYLCRKNEGHLIRIVGPAFEQVCGWANLGVPLKVAFRGIDQYCERYYAKGPRRRPVRIEFCEADILDLFDAWRRAIGVVQAEGAAADRASAAEACPRGAHRTGRRQADGPARRWCEEASPLVNGSTRSCVSSTIWPRMREGHVAILAVQ